MAETWNGSNELGSETEEGNYIEKIHLEPLYDSFICPLTKQVMRDHVSLENGQTFEREAIVKWFKQCKSGRKRVCPVTRKELRSTDLNPCIALRNTIEEWIARNEAVQLDTALVDAFHHGDYRTRQIAERALKHVDRLPNFSEIFTKIG